MNGGLSSPPTARHAELLALAGELRPELHRYCARLMGSVIDGEDAVQDALTRAFVALDELEEAPALRPWLFRIAHNRALDLMRSRAIRAAEPIEAAYEVADPESPDPVEALIQSSYPLRAGRAEVGMFFSIYARQPPARVGPARLDGREVIAIWEDTRAAKPSYFMWLEWTDGRISFIRDYRHVPYVVDDAELVLAADGSPPVEGNREA